MGCFEHHIFKEKEMDENKEEMDILVPITVSLKTDASLAVRFLSAEGSEFDPKTVFPEAKFPSRTLIEFPTTKPEGIQIPGRFLGTGFFIPDEHRELWKECWLVKKTSIIYLQVGPAKGWDTKFVSIEYGVATAISADEHQQIVEPASLEGRLEKPTRIWKLDDGDFQVDGKSILDITEENIMKVSTRTILFVLQAPPADQEGIHLGPECGFSIFLD